MVLRTFYISLFTACLLLLLDEAGAVAVPDANSFCIKSCSQRRNSKDLYTDPNDCHRYYQCFYFNDSYVVGMRRACPPGAFWHDSVLQCMPEGDTPCVDICNTPNSPPLGCYARPKSCSAFFVCANSASYPFCCPKLTRFNGTTCSCDADDKCLDLCSLPKPRPTTVKPPSAIDSRKCRDSFNNILGVAPGMPQFFLLFDKTGGNNTLLCAPGTAFDLKTCRCEDNNEPLTATKTSRQCRLYMPFDVDLQDYSSSRFSVFPFGKNVSVKQSGLCRGAGVLWVNQSRLEIPGLKSVDFKRQASWCLYFKPDKIMGSKFGGLMSNSDSASKSHMSFILAASGSTGVQAMVNLTQKNFVNIANTNLTNTSHNTANGFVQICVVFGGGFVKLYRNNQLLFTYSAPGELGISHCPYVIGTDYSYGNYTGYVDEVLVCDFAMTAQEVNAHWAGQVAMINAGLVPSSSAPQTTTPYTNLSPRPSPSGTCGHNMYWNSGEKISPVLGIVGGTDAKPFEFPWQALFVLVVSSTETHFCGAVVLSQSWLITAGHCCVTDWQLLYRTVLLGGNAGWGSSDRTPDNLAKIAALFKATRNITQVVVHPLYNASDSWAYDFCLIKMNAPVSFNTWAIQPICLPKSCNDTCQPGDNVEISGFGLTAEYNGLLPSTLLKGVIQVMNNSACETSRSRPAGFVASHGAMCAGTSDGGINICHGDSGGPLSCYKNGYFSLNGLTSTAVGCAEPNYPSVFSAVCRVLPWINSYINS